GPGVGAKPCPRLSRTTAGYAAVHPPAIATWCFIWRTGRIGCRPVSMEDSMGAGFVKVMLIGNLGKDPEVRFTAGGTAVANLRVACTERAKGKDGNWEDRTEWVALVC